MKFETDPTLTSEHVHIQRPATPRFLEMQTSSHSMFYNRVISTYPDCWIGLRGLETVDLQLYRLAFLDDHVWTKL
jgi:hypothetical protein